MAGLASMLSGASPPKEEKCAQVQGQDAAIFFGGAGSGKTTVTSICCSEALHMDSSNKWVIPLKVLINWCFNWG